MLTEQLVEKTYQGRPVLRFIYQNPFSHFLCYHPQGPDKSCYLRNTLYFHRLLLELIFWKIALALRDINMSKNSAGLIQNASGNFFPITKSHWFVMTKKIHYNLKKQTPFLLAHYNHLINTPSVIDSPLDGSLKTLDKYPFQSQTTFLLVHHKHLIKKYNHMHGTYCLYPWD